MVTEIYKSSKNKNPILHAYKLHVDTNQNLFLINQLSSK